MNAILKIALLSLVLLVSGCHFSSPLYAPPAVLGDLLVSVYDAKVKNGHVWVKMNVYNGSDKAIIVDRDGFALRMPNGGVLKRASGITTRHTPYVVAPREQRRVYVDFRGPAELTSMDDMFLIVGGIRLAGQLAPHVAGEVPLVGSYDRIAPPPMSASLDDPPAVPRASKSKGDRAPAAEPPRAEQAAGKRLTVAVDLGHLDDASYERLEGVELEKQLIVRLVQDGFAVVAPSEDPAAVLVLRMKKESVVLRVQGDGRAASRTIADTGQDRGVLHHELVQKASALVYEHSDPSRGEVRSKAKRDEAAGAVAEAAGGEVASGEAASSETASSEVTSGEAQD